MMHGYDTFRIHVHKNKKFTKYQQIRYKSRNFKPENKHTNKIFFEIKEKESYQGAPKMMKQNNQ